ncbi:MAG: hypothetical protein ACLQNE_46740 [Thermoguttaceae bacterium]|jgi:hypothetical protein
MSNNPVVIGCLSLVALVLGATVLGMILEGPIFFFAGPVLALFGWFYLVPIILLVWLACAVIEHRFFRGRRVYWFMASGAIVGALFMAVFGVKEIGVLLALQSHTHLEVEYPGPPFAA